MFIRGTPTGQYRFRPAWSGVALEIQIRWSGMAAHSRVVTDNNLEWRRADMIDLLHPALRRLIDGGEPTAIYISAPIDQATFDLLKNNLKPPERVEG